MIVAMLALLLFLFMGPSPMVYSSGVTVNLPGDAAADELAERCAGLPEVEWRRCQPRMINLGSWEARPSPDEWDKNAYQSPPSEFGTYATEKRE